MRRIYGVGEISKIIPTSIVISTVVPPANTFSAAERRCASKRPAASNSRNPRVCPPRPSRGPLFVHLTRWRTVARDGLRYQRFVAHWQHAAAPIYCALPRSPLHLAFPSASVIRRLLEPLTLSFLFFFPLPGLYISTAARFFPPLFLYFSLRCFFELQFRRPFHSRFIFIPYIFPPPLFSLFHSFLLSPSVLLFNYFFVLSFSSFSGPP